VHAPINPKIHTGMVGEITHPTICEIFLKRQHDFHEGCPGGEKSGCDDEGVEIVLTPHFRGRHHQMRDFGVQLVAKHSVFIIPSHAILLIVNIGAMPGLSKS